MLENDFIVIANVSASYFSVARHTGDVNINGKLFVYCPIRDILVRNDWMKAYQTLDYNKFLEAVKSGVKPELPSNTQRGRKAKNKSDKSIKTETPSLFD